MNSVGPGAMTVGDLGEFPLIDRIRRVLGDVPGVVLGIGDDSAAVRPTPGKLILATCDVQVQGRHFIMEHITPEQLGRRSAVVNLSDIAAMGGRPTYALVSLVLPSGTEVEWVERLYVGFREAFSEHGAVVIGGNLSGAGEEIVIDITMHGEADEASMLRRSGSKPGDVVLVTGNLGASAIGRMSLTAGLRAEGAESQVVQAHLGPVARVAEGEVVADSGLATAMIDVSDGLLADLDHVCAASAVGARIFANHVPITAEAHTVAAELDVDPLSAALHGGEDYELVVTCASSVANSLINAVTERTGTPLTVIGEIVDSPGVRLVGSDGSERQLTETGWDHFGGMSL